MKEITAYQCEYCHSIYKTKSYMKKHEAMCFLNPNNRACWMCEYNLHIMEDNEYMCEKYNESIEEMSEMCHLRFYKKQSAIMQCPFFQLKNTHKCGYCKHNNNECYGDGHYEEQICYSICNLKLGNDNECSEEEEENGCPNFEKK